jgi:hypothetical protein
MIAQNRDAHGRLRVPFFVNLICEYRGRHGFYNPGNFKLYVEGLGILTPPDRACESCGYAKWKHRIDRAAQRVFTNI